MITGGTLSPVMPQSPANRGSGRGNNEDWAPSGNTFRHKCQSVKGLVDESGESDHQILLYWVGQVYGLQKPFIWYLSCPSSYKLNRKEVMAIFISYSRESTYLHCPYQHWLRYVRRLEKKKPERPLYFGTDFHRLLELRNDPEALKAAKKDIKETFYELPPSYQSDLGDNYVQDLFTIFKDYTHVYQGVRQPQLTEQTFSIVVGKDGTEPIVFVGKIDELYLLKRQGVKSITVGEHKTFTNKPNMDLLVMNPQKCLYAKAAYFLKGILPDKVKWDYIKSTPASQPIWLEKTKRFSEAASTKITPMSWRRACKEHGILDPEILAKGDRYASNISEFFFQVELDIDPAMVEDIWDGYMYTAKQIIRYGSGNKTKNVTRDCSWCSYRDICYSEMTGGDTEYIIAKDYDDKSTKG